MKKLGVIGGLGPLASAYFLELITDMCDALSDQEHIETIVYSKPSTPDRTAYILDNTKPDPVPSMVQSGAVLKAMGVDVLAIPCITAHYFHEKLEELIGMRIINAISETVDYLKRNGYKRVGIMATDGTVKSGIFKLALESSGIECIYPKKEHQDGVMRLIYDNVKSGKRVDIDSFNEIKMALIDSGAEVVLLGCTELSVIKKNSDIKDKVVDVMEVLAAKCVDECATLKEEYAYLAR